MTDSCRFEIALTPVRRLAPSRFAAFVACPLREVFRAVDAPRLLAAVAAAHLGTVIHTLLEHAADTALPELIATRLFEDLVRTEETAMQSSVGSRAAVPLADCVPDFEVRKRRAIRAAVSTPTRSHSDSAPRRGAGPRFGTEVWVETRDKELGGYVDDVILRDHCVVLRDHKSGAASRPGSESFQGAVQQLQLYAALYEETTGTWPQTVEIVPVDGEPVPITVDRVICTQLLVAARRALHECNATVTASENVRTAAHALGRPTPATCRRCAYRPICAAYLVARQRDSEWPRDVIGAVIQRAVLRNGTVFFRLHDARGDVATIRGIVADESYPGLPRVVVGTEAGFFNLVGGKDGGSYSASPRTTIVPLPVQPF